MLDAVVFDFFAALAVVSGILVVISRSAVQSAIFLVTALLATAGIFLTLHAEFLFVVQIILYAGGIMVLFIFVIMLVNLDVALHQVQFNRRWLVALLLALLLGLQVVAALALSKQSLAGIIPLPVQLLDPNNTEQVGSALFHPYMLSFEIASILLLVAMIGAVVMSKKRV